MITHEEARKAPKYYDTTHKLIETDFYYDYITQQEKVTELLGLYKTLSNLLYEGDYGSLIKTNEIQKTIEQLEKELGEMK